MKATYLKFSTFNAFALPAYLNLRLELSYFVKMLFLNQIIGRRMTIDFNVIRTNKQ